MSEMSAQQQIPPMNENYLNMSIAMGVLIIVLTVIMLVSVIANCWLRRHKLKIIVSLFFYIYFLVEEVSFLTSFHFSRRIYHIKKIK